MPRSDKNRGRAGQFAFEGLDRVIHEKARLGILASLAAHGDGLLFTDLKKACSLTDGNLSRHLAVLSDARLVKALKGKQGPRSQTRYRLTASGRKRFTAYIGLLGRIVSDASPELRTGPVRTEPGQQGMSPGLSGA